MRYSSDKEAPFKSYKFLEAAKVPGQYVQELTSIGNKPTYL